MHHLARAALLALAAALIPTAGAWAACSTMEILDGTGSAKNVCVTTDGSGNIVPSHGLVGGTNNANKANVESNGSVDVQITNPAAVLVDGNSVTPPLSITVAGTYLVGAAASSQFTRITGYHIEGNGWSGGYKFIQGTHTTTDCDTSATDLTPVFPLDTTQHPGAARGDGSSTLKKTSSTNKQICIVVSGTGTSIAADVTIFTGP